MSPLLSPAQVRTSDDTSHMLPPPWEALFSQLTSMLIYADQSWMFSSGSAYQGEFCFLLACQLVARTTGLVACASDYGSFREAKPLSPSRQLCLRIAGSARSALQDSSFSVCL